VFKYLDREKSGTWVDVYTIAEPSESEAERQADREAAGQAGWLAGWLGRRLVFYCIFF